MPLGKCQQRVAIKNDLDHLIFVEAIDAIQHPLPQRLRRDKVQPADHQQQTLRIVEALVGIARRSIAPTVKLLFASPARSEFIEHLFLAREILDLPQVCPSRGRYDEGKLRDLVKLENG